MNEAVQSSECKEGKHSETDKVLIDVCQYLFVCVEECIARGVEI